MFDRRRKGLGAVAAEESTSEPWELKFVKENDNLTTLSAAYGVTPKEILDKNHVKFTTHAIQAWVKRSNGKVLPFVQSSHPFANSQEGWAVFTAGSQILLPPFPRKDGEPTPPPAGEREPPGLLPLVQKSSGAKILVALGLAGAVTMLMFSSKSAKDRTAPRTL